MPSVIITGPEEFKMSRWGGQTKRSESCSNESQSCVAGSVLGRSCMLRSHAYATQGAEHTSTIRGHVGRIR